MSKISNVSPSGSSKICEAVLAVLELETEDVPGERRHLVKARCARAEPDDALQFHETRLDPCTVARRSESSLRSPGSPGTTAARRSSRALRDTAMEVIYTGLHQTPEQIVETAFRKTPMRSGSQSCPTRTRPRAGHPRRAEQDAHHGRLRRSFQTLKRTRIGSGTLSISTKATPGRLAGI